MQPLLADFVVVAGILVRADDRLSRALRSVVDWLLPSRWNQKRLDVVDCLLPSRWNEKRLAVVDCLLPSRWNHKRLAGVDCVLPSRWTVSNIKPSKRLVLNLLPLQSSNQRGDLRKIHPVWANDCGKVCCELGEHAGNPKPTH